MPELDAIRRIAKQTLSAAGPAGTQDNWLWDRTVRILRKVEYICRMPDLASQAKAIDRFSLVTATLFADSGLTRCAESADVSAHVRRADISLKDLCDSSAQVISDVLAQTVPGPRIDRAGRIIRQSADRSTKLTEAMILSDARNLDDMGVVGLYNECRRHFIHGKGVTDILESWKRKVDYRYWQARLSESFHFESVRKLAERRYAAAENLMSQLAIENDARDIEELLRQSLEEQKAK